ncbi:bifunctional 4-hydroxy-2-oxoglutarate aldolase/2-dehydro-3-deoxy-phosphogluconate aldolase [Streptomyces sp. NPDC021356]|uniref:bifunctional 4-hydroxy-2-oxoglutarate aldolase/2-dehydro-3-deoxy-phosphogluconate aldolase n=1 Tax=Streptomyces sp. NPDC021356 TaxID=3154900 RepID=UPI0033EE152B
MTPQNPPSSPMTAPGRLFEQAFTALPLMVILRGLGIEATVAMSRRAWDHGIPLVEVPVQDESAVAALAAAAAAGRERGAVVGAGTVTSTERLTRAVRAGAAFTVAPGFSAEVAEASVRAGLPHLPGVSTPSEIQQALACGFTWLKAFPAAELGAGWLRAMRGPFPEARLVATGGMTVADAQEFLSAGADAVSLGSALSDPAQVRRLPRLVVELTEGAAR